MYASALGDSVHSGSNPSNLFTTTQRADGAHHNGCFLLLLLLLAQRGEKTRCYIHKVTLKRRACCWAAGRAVGKCQDHMLRRSLAKGHNRGKHMNAGSSVGHRGGLSEFRGRCLRGCWALVTKLCAEEGFLFNSPLFVLFRDTNVNNLSEIRQLYPLLDSQEFSGFVTRLGLER